MAEFYLYFKLFPAAVWTTAIYVNRRFRA